MTNSTFKVEGMHCNKCSERIERVLKGMDEVKTVVCDLKAKSVHVESEMSNAALKEMIEDMGFDVVE